MPWSRAVYRSRQVFHALRPRIDPDALEEVHDLLNQGEAALFFDMPKRDQRHALEVAGRLRAQGIDNRELIAAALLHDCGKGDVPVWLRILNVVSPAAVQDMGRRFGAGPAYRLANHVALSAAAAKEAGSNPATVRLIRGRPETDEAGLMTLLIAADDAS